LLVTHITGWKNMAKEEAIEVEGTII